MVIMKKILKKSIAIILISMLVLTCNSCDDEYWDEDYEEYGESEDYEDGEYDAENQVIPEGDVDSINGLSMQVNNSNGDISISRKDVESKARPDDGIWTIFVYLCGTDLESQSGMGTDDLTEMMNASPSNKVRFVVQTGGTDGWNTSEVDDGMIQRFVVQAGNIEKVDEASLESMGRPDTLTDFHLIL